MSSRKQAIGRLGGAATTAILLVKRVAEVSDDSRPLVDAIASAFDWIGISLLAAFLCSAVIAASGLSPRFAALLQRSAISARDLVGRWPVHFALGVGLLINAVGWLTLYHLVAPSDRLLEAEKALVEAQTEIRKLETAVSIQEGEVAALEDKSQFHAREAASAHGRINDCERRREKNARAIYPTLG